VYSLPRRFWENRIHGGESGTAKNSPSFALKEAWTSDQVKHIEMQNDRMGKPEICVLDHDGMRCWRNIATALID
jgi:hypothetical protein